VNHHTFALARFFSKLLALADEIEDGQTGFLIERASTKRDRVNSGWLGNT